MAMTFQPTDVPQSVGAAEETLETPFLEIPHAVGTASPPAASAEAPFLPESPFLSEYVVGEETIRPEQPALLELLEELYDAEFDEAIADLAAEAETYVAELGLGESESDQARAEQMLEAWIEPLRREAQAMLVGLAEAFEAEDPLSMTEDRFDVDLRAVPARATASTARCSRASREVAGQEGEEHRQGCDQGGEGGHRRGLQDHADRDHPAKAGRARSAAAHPGPEVRARTSFRSSTATPPSSWPAGSSASTSRSRGRVEEEDLDEDELDEAEWELRGRADADEQPATADVRQIQDAFDAEAVGLVFAPSEQEQDLYLAEAAVASAASDALAAGRARRRPEHGSSTASRGSTKARTRRPLVQNFLPAILPALRLGLKVAGRPRVVRFLAEYLGRLIAPYVGPSVVARAVARDRRRRAAGDDPRGRRRGERRSPRRSPPRRSPRSSRTPSHASPSSTRRTSSSRTPSSRRRRTRRSTSRRPPNFPADGAVAAERVRRGRPRRRQPGCPMPRGGPWRYRKYSRVFNVVIHPAAARAITTFGGRPLSAFLRDRLGRSGPIRARIHLYQAVPGSSLARIARAERGVAGSDRPTPAAGRGSTRSRRWRRRR